MAFGIGDAIGIGSSLLGFASGRATNRAAAREAEASREFTREQMQNRHQWEVEDLRKAGLNPVLSAGSAPSIGGSAQAPVINPIESAAQAANSAMAAKRLNAEIDNIRQDTEKKKSEMNLNDNLGAKAVQEWNLLRENIDIARSNSHTAKSEARMAANAETRSRLEKEWYNSKAGRFGYALEKLNPLSAINSGKSQANFNR